MARIQVGIVAYRAADGAFLSARPICREVNTVQDAQNEDIFTDALLQLFADKFKEYKKAQKRKEDTYGNR